MPNVSHKPRHLAPNQQLSSGQTDQNFSEKSFNELRSLAKERGINTYRMNKGEIISALSGRS